MIAYTNGLDPASQAQGIATIMGRRDLTQFEAHGEQNEPIEHCKTITQVDLGSGPLKSSSTSTSTVSLRP